MMPWFEIMWVEMYVKGDTNSEFEVRSSNIEFKVQTHNSTLCWSPFTYRLKFQLNVKMKTKERAGGTEEKRGEEKRRE